MMRLLWILAGVATGFFAFSASAQDEVLYSSGTGFFVSRWGQIITNHHVVENCKSIHVRGAVPYSEAVLEGYDPAIDLALLKTKARPEKIATIRHPDAFHLKVGESLFILGYPGESFQTGQYQVARSKIIGLAGPVDQEQWIQFDDSVQQGNSGGPLLDESGNVVGVVVGKAEVYNPHGKNGQKEVISKSDVAINLHHLLRFLDRHVVAYDFIATYQPMLPNRVEENARQYIVNVLCEVRE